MTDQLTARELELVTMYADGSDNYEIAAELLLSIETVKSHAKHLLVKLGARNRAHAVALAYHRGLLLPKN